MSMTLGLVVGAIPIDDPEDPDAYRGAFFYELDNGRGVDLSAADEDRAVTVALTREDVEKLAQWASGWLQRHPKE